MSRSSRMALQVLALTAVAAGVVGCTADETDAETTDVSRDPVFTHKMMKSTGENPFASLGYECSQCTFEQWLAIEPPEGWTKGPAQVLLASSGELRNTLSLDGVPDSMDFVEEIPGNEYQLIVKNLDGEIVEASGNGIIAQTRVMRITCFASMRAGGFMSLPTLTATSLFSLRTKLIHRTS